ncbi:MAG: GGDEF domain-containing protein [Lachnospiraceae bacterium]|nr:GGDEF domain-containing protein [Lachnospiraceae bacterium]
MIKRLRDYLKQYSQWFAPIFLFILAVVIILAVFLDHTAIDSQSRAQAEIVSDALMMKRTVELKLVEDRTMVRLMQKALADVDDPDGEEAVKILEHAVEAGIGYMALLLDEEGNGISSAGAQVSLAGEPWYTEVSGIEPGDMQTIHVKDDGLTGADAVVTLGGVAGPDGSRKVCLYFDDTWISTLSVTGKGKSIMTIVGMDGRILMRSEISDYFIRGDNYWALIGGDAQTSARNHIKRGDAYGIYLAENGYTVIEVPLHADVPWAACISVSGNYIGSLADTYFTSTKNLVVSLLIALVAFLALTVILNVISKMRRLKESEALGQKADHDQLTGLRNKAATERDIQAYIDENPSTQSVLFILDIDDFKSVNDTMGHSFGDDVLHEFGFRLGSMFRASDVAGRIGGDEFMVFVKNLPNEDTIEHEARKIREFIQSFYAGEGVKKEITASSGAAVYPMDGKDFESLYKSADKALYESKRNGKRQLAFFRK